MDLVTCWMPPQAPPAKPTAAAPVVALIRRLPLLFTRAGLQDVRVRGFFPLETDPRGFYAGLAERAAETALTVGAITEAERRGWLDALHAEQARGPVIAGRLHIFTWGRRPA